MTATSGTVAPLPICPPLVPGESFPSWMNRIAARCRLPLGLLLARLSVAHTDRHHAMPTTYGLTLTATQIDQIAAMTGATPAVVAGTLLTAYRDGPADLTGLDVSTDASRSIADITRSEWLHVTRSLYCPDCLRETEGAWQLAWRLPWSFACTTHKVMLGSTCPGCQQPAGQGRGDRTARPHFIALVPDPESCGNAVAGADVGFVGRPGRAARPCGHNFADTVAPALGDGQDAVLEAQAVLNRLLAVGGHRNTWADLRALVTVLLVFTDTTTLAALAPDLTPAIFTIPQVADAITSHDLARADRAEHQQRVRDGGLDHRTGVRQRHGTTTPQNPALMAVLTPVALQLLGSLPGDDTERAGDRAHAGLDLLARLARDQRKHLAVMLATAGATPGLIERAEQAVRRTGKFTYAIPTASGMHIDASTIPAYLWATEAAPFLACLPGTREDTVRKFASLHLVKTLTGDTWQQAATRLGHPAGPIATLTANLVNRLSKAGTQEQFLLAAQDVLARLGDGTLPAINYAQRRRALHSLRSVPAELLHAAGFVATASRRRNSAAWLWADLTGGHPHHAPAWGRAGASPSQREVYRRYLQEHLPSVRDSLRVHGQERLEAAGGGESGRFCPTPKATLTL